MLRPFSPCGRRWTREARPDEGFVSKPRGALRAQPLTPNPSPATARRETGVLWGEGSARTDVNAERSRLMPSRHSLAGRAITRMNGAGNRILVLDLRGSDALPSAADARAIHRAPGLAYDQMMVLTDPSRREAAADVMIFNNDGTLAGACGNGTRCVADRLCRELGTDAVLVETEAGLIACERLSEWRYRADMGPPRLDWRDIPLARPVADTRRVALEWPDGDPATTLGPAATVNMGNPHAVFFVPDLAAVDAASIGPRIEKHPMFPEKANVTFAEIETRRRVRTRVWERGVGFTLACGSAACATLVAASRLDLMDREGTLVLPGGELTVAWRESDGHVLMTGPVEFLVGDRLAACRHLRQALLVESCASVVAPPGSSLGPNSIPAAPNSAWSGWKLCPSWRMRNASIRTILLRLSEIRSPSQITPHT